MHIHLAPDSIEDFLARFAKLSLYKDTIAIDTREMIDNQDICCHRKSDFDNYYHTLHCKKSGVHPFGKQVVNIWKRSIIHAFSDIFRKENPTFSRCFRVGKLEYSFHYPAVFLHSELYENDCFLSVKSTVNRRENSLYSVVYWCFLSNKTLFSQTFSVEDNAFSSIF